MTSTVSDKRDKRSLDYAIRSGIAGGTAGCVAKTVVAPLDRVKILFQASNPDYQKYAGSWSGAYRAVASIYNQSGVRGLLQGHSATLLRIFPYAGIKFMAYDQWRPLLMPTKESETNSRRFLAGALAGLTSVTFTYPLELIRVRMAFQTHSAPDHTRWPSFIRAMSVIYHENSSLSSLPEANSGSVPAASKQLFHRFPILKFYRGFTVTMVGMIPYAGTAFLTWDYLRSSFYPKPTKEHPRPPLIADLTIGALSGALSQTASYPFEVIRRRMQVGGLTRPDRWLRWGETAKAIYDARGWRGFYVGLGIGYLKIVPMTAVSFAVWQGTKRMLGLDGSS